MQYESVIWDWNGTLLDDVALSISVVNEILLDHGLQTLDIERYQQIFDFPVKLYYERAGMDFSTTTFEAVSERFCSNFEAKLGTAQLFDTTTSALTRLQSAGLHQFILSSTEQHALQRMLSHFQLTDTFHAVAGLPDGFARGKIQVGERLVREHHIDPTKAVLVGDTFHDWEVAKNLGLDCVLVTSGHHSYERLIKTGCPVFSSVEEVANHVCQTTST